MPNSEINSKTTVTASIKITLEDQIWSSV